MMGLAKQCIARRRATRRLAVRRGAVLFYLLINKNCCIFMVPVFSIFYSFDSFLLFFFSARPDPAQGAPGLQKGAPT